MAAARLTTSRESGISLHPPLQPLLPANGSVEMKQDTELARAAIVESEKLFVPMDLARSRIALLSKELQDMRAAHLSAIDGITAKYEAISASTRDQWIATFDKLKVRAHEKVRDAKQQLHDLQLKFNECVATAKTREERLLAEIADYKLAAVPGSGAAILASKHEVEQKLLKLNSDFAMLQKENATLRALSQQMQSVASSSSSPLAVSVSASASPAHAAEFKIDPSSPAGLSGNVAANFAAELAQRTASEAALRAQLKERIDAENMLSDQLEKLKGDKHESELQYQSKLARLEMERDQSLKASQARVDQLQLQVAALEATGDDPDGRYAEIKSLLESEREQFQTSSAEKQEVENMLREEVERYQTELREKTREFESLQAELAATQTKLAEASSAAPAAVQVVRERALPLPSSRPLPRPVLSPEASTEEIRAALAAAERELEVKTREASESRQLIAQLQSSGASTATGIVNVDAVVDADKPPGESSGDSDALRAQLDAKVHALGESERQVVELQRRVDELVAAQSANASTREAEMLKGFQQRTEALQAEHTAQLSKMESELAAVGEQLAASKAEAGGLKASLDAETAAKNEALSSLAQTTADFQKLTAESSTALTRIAELKSNVEERDLALLERATKIAEQKSALEQAASDIERLNFKYRAENERRKKMQFEYEAIKGKIRVYARIRPFSVQEKQRNEDKTPCIRPGPTEWDVELNNPRKNLNGVWEDVWVSYTLDHVFLAGRNGTQQHVFEETKGFCELACNGINACIFAYGQSGTGKTWTMAGSKMTKDGVPTPENVGLKPRSIDEVYRIADDLKASYTYKISSYMVEIYLNKLEDLYWKLKTKRAGAENKRAEAQPVPPELKVRVGQGRKVVIDNVEVCTFKTAEELHEWSDEAEQLRRVRRTGLNEQSSRSHLIFALIIEQTEIKTKKVKVGKLSLVDLAGSERAEKTNVDGLTAAEREAMIKEGLAINQSLTQLKNVFRVLGEKSGVDENGKPKNNKELVQYRGNQLTELLQDSLGGASRTLMFVNVGPSQANVNESIDSLSYGNLVSNISNEIASADQDVAAENKALREELEALKARLG